MHVEQYVPKSLEGAEELPSSPGRASSSDNGIKRVRIAEKIKFRSPSSVFLIEKHPSRWSTSRAKRVFDCVCVVSLLPVIVPSLLLIGLAVRLTSQGPVLFLQRRVGHQGRNFTILKFRTMIHNSDQAHHPVTTSGNQLFTPVGPFLRRWKLDELPQLLNVLAGHMSLVGPRPKLPAHAIGRLPCRCGITGAATVAFAGEEEILDRVPKHHLEAFYHSAVLPAKHKLDAEYMAQATFWSDLAIIFDSVFRRWDTSTVEHLLNTWAFDAGDKRALSGIASADALFPHGSMVAQMEHPASTGQARAF